MHIECMVMHDVQNESLVFFYQLGLLSPLPSGENEVSQTPHYGYNPQESMTNALSILGDRILEEFITRKGKDGVSYEPHECQHVPQSSSFGENKMTQ